MSDFVTLGELLIDFTPAGSKDGRNLFMQNAGGAVANAAAAYARLGGSAAFMGMVGNDQFGRFLKETMGAAGVDTDGMILSNEYNTTLAFVHLFEDGQRDFSFYRKPGADIMYKSENIDTAIIDGCKVFHVGTLSLTDEAVRSAHFEAVEYAKDAGKIITYDPNYRAPLWRSENEAKEFMTAGLEYADIIKISDNEIEFLFGDIDYEDAAKMLVDQGISLVYITLGKDGVVFANSEGVGRAGGFKANAVDATGAGDCFTGSVIYRFVNAGKDLGEFRLDDMRDAATFANAAASICVEGLGGIPSMPTQAQVEKRLKSQ